MPRSSRQQQAANHDLILQNAARLVRERGVDGFSVPEVMRAAGLTHGGFYKHFPSKEDLLVQAETTAFAARVASLQEVNARAATAAAAREEFLSSYLSTGHRDNPGAGCPAAALAADAAHPDASDAVRSAFIEGVRGMVVALEDGRQASDPSALAELATLVGAVLLARATVGDTLSEQFLTAARSHLSASSPSNLSDRDRY